jgi:hypothetical protein
MSAAVLPRPAAGAAATILDTSRELDASRMMRAWAVTGLVFMLLPGTFLGVWNLISISAARGGAGALSPAWMQAHGHAQVFGWIGSFILGIGFFSLPRTAMPTMSRAWISWALWTGGVALRWATNVYLWHWRIGLPLSAAMELTAWGISFATSSRHRRAHSGSGKKSAPPAWMAVVLFATLMFGLTLAVNFGATLWCVVSGNGPAFPHLFDQRYLVLLGWGFLAPFVWGFSARWLPIFLGLAPVRSRWLIAAVLAGFGGVLAAAVGVLTVATLLIANACIFAVIAMRVFEPGERAAKTDGVHASFPVFLRAAYVWLWVAAGLGMWAARADMSGGIWGASRHALTVGFVSTIVFAIGQRILPHFAGMRALFSTRLMFASLVLLNVGCALRVSCEPLAYEGIAHFAWKVLPLSAVTELTAVTVFAINLFCTFRFSQPIAVNPSGDR